MDRIMQNHSSSNHDHLHEKEIATQIITHENQNESDESVDRLPTNTKSTRDDAIQMQRMGRDQQFVRGFQLVSVASFTALCTAAWELGLFLITPALVDGGRPALLYNFLWSFVGFGPIYLSMAEMASMAPIAGAQYHWVSEFAPEGLQRILSYLTGWTSTLAWQAGNALGVFLVGSLIQSLISINNPDYTFPAWHATLLVIAVVIMTFIANTYGSKILPLWQNAVCALHILTLFALIIPIWVKAPKIPSREVWSGFENYGGWSNMGITILVGQAAGIYSQVGLDTAAHMSEETKDAAKMVPWAIISIYIINFLVTFPMLVTLCYHMPSVADSLVDPTLYPAIYVFRQVDSLAWMNAILIATIVILMASNISYLAAVSRDAFAFGRDQGLPFSNWIAYVNLKRRIPLNACIVTSVISILMALLYLGSDVTFYAITSLCTVALLQCYCLSIGCLLWRRIKQPETLPPARFSLGRWGIPINIMAVAFSFWSFIWCFFPQSVPVTASGFNWASALFMAAVVIAAVDYIFRGRHKYFGPVTLVRGRYNNASL